MWVPMLVCILSRPTIHAISHRSVTITLRTWVSSPSLRDHPMRHELRATADRVDAFPIDTGYVSLVDPNGYVRAIGVLRSNASDVFLRDVACADYESGSILVRTITRTPGVRCADDLPARWRVAHTYHAP